MATFSHGYYFDGRSATKYPVTATVMGSGLQIAKENGEVVFWPYEQIRQTDRFHSGERVRLERGRPIAEILVLDDDGLLGMFQRVASETHPRFRSPIRRSTWLTLSLLAGVGALMMVVALYLWGIPAFADAVASRVPVAWEEQLGEAVVEEVSPISRRCTDVERLKIIDQIVSRLKTGTPPTPYTFRITVLSGPIINAFAAPGGQIVLFQGLLAKTKTPEELAGVLAHEMQHVMQRHGTKALFRKQSMGVLISALSGNAGGLNSALHAAGTLGQLRYSRKDEEAADRDGMKMLQGAKVNPTGMVSFFRTLQKEEGEMPRALAYVSTHPPIKARIDALQQQAEQATYAPVPLLPNYPWGEINKICRTQLH